MWNILSDLRKREHDLYNHPLNKDYIGSKLLLKHMELKHYKSNNKRDCEKIKFNHNGNLFSFTNSEPYAGCIWDTIKRKEIFKIELDCCDDFRILNKFNQQDDLAVAVAYFDKIDFKNITPAGDAATMHTINFVEKYCLRPAMIALSPQNETQIFCNVKKGSLYHIDLRSNPTIIGRYQHEQQDYEILQHDPIKNEVCMAGSKAGVHIFDTRKLCKPLKTHNLAVSEHWSYCSYNFNGSEILAFDRCKRKAHMIFNDNTANNFTTYDTEFQHEPLFFGPKSEFLVYFQENEEEKTWVTAQLVFQDKHNMHVNKIEHALDLFFVPYEETTMTAHPNKPLIVAYICYGEDRLAYITPRDSFDEHVCTEDGVCCKDEKVVTPQQHSPDYGFDYFF